MRSQDNACESYFHSSIVEKEQFNFKLESSEVRLHLGRIPNRVLGEQLSSLPWEALHRLIVDPKGKSTATPLGRLPSLVRRLRVHSRANRGRHRTNGPSPRSHLPRQPRIPSEVRRYLPFWPGWAGRSRPRQQKASVGTPPALKHFRLPQWVFHLRDAIGP